MTEIKDKKVREGILLALNLIKGWRAEWSETLYSDSIPDLIRSDQLTHGLMVSDIFIEDLNKMLGIDGDSE